MNEYKKWAQTAKELGLDSVRAGIEKAMKMLVQSNNHLEKALKTVREWPRNMEIS
jgi:hypothetical protein